MHHCEHEKFEGSILDCLLKLLNAEAEQRTSVFDMRHQILRKSGLSWFSSKSLQIAGWAFSERIVTCQSLSSSARKLD